MSGARGVRPVLSARRQWRGLKAHDAFVHDDPVMLLPRPHRLTGGGEAPVGEGPERHANQLWHSRGSPKDVRTAAPTEIGAYRMSAGRTAFVSRRRDHRAQLQGGGRRPPTL